MQTAGLSGPGAMAYDAKRVNALTGFRTLFGFGPGLARFAPVEFYSR